MLTVVVVNAALIATLGWELLDRDRRIRDYRQARQAETVAQILAVGSAPAMALQDQARLQRWAQAAVGADAVDHVGFANASGRVLARSGEAAISQPAAPRSEAPGEKGESAARIVARTDQAFVAAAPIQSDGRPIGTVQVQVGRAGIIPAEQQMRLFALAYGTAVILLGGLVAFLVARSVTARLRRLAAAADRFRRGEHGTRLADDLPDEVGSVARGVNAMLDAIAASERSLKDVFRIARIGSWRYSPADGRIHLSDELREILGFEASAMAPSAQEFMKSLAPRQQRKLADLLRSGDPTRTYSFTFSLPLPEGGRRFCWAEARAETRQDSQERELVGTCQDITERETAAAQLRQAQKMESVGQLTGGLAHDFNNLLAVVIGNLELLEETFPDRSEAQEFIQDALTAAMGGSQLTRQLLAFSRRQALSPRKVDLNRLMREMSTLWRRTLGEAIDIRIHFADNAWATWADPSQVDSAVLNLVINARDAMPDGGILTVETSNASIDPGSGDEDEEVDIRPGDYAVIAVSDNGIGMPPEIAARAFEPFFTTKAVGKGSGLGLSMIYGFAKQSGGTVKIYSEPGQGTTVRLYLPRYVPGKDSSAEPAQPAAMPLAANETVLLVEDNDGVRRLLTRQLQALGYTVLTAGNGPEALDVLNGSEPVDVLFTDVVMPGGYNGFALGKLAREIRPDLKVLYMSGFTRPSAQEVADSATQAELLTKPFRKIDLALKLREILEGGSTSLI